MGWAGKQNECGAATCNPCFNSPKQSSSIRSQCAASTRHLTAALCCTLLCCAACCHAGAAAAAAAAAAARKILSLVLRGCRPLDWATVGLDEAARGGRGGRGGQFFPTLPSSSDST
ncbi:hypothetical protein CNYM01_10866 [Colletotrichum nymphaeae SA-01]|uniref:Uncharacterized protein n=1 Tax=Colletotrichum nymphaeae SA-01 TaxID=1460502 RepID=A0A135UNX3_9PEZI|nr:hypothetical protein CNYM01_10866 [Colletotrichum nymphaeae SA-01]